MKRMTLAAVTVVALFLLLIAGTTNASASTFYCGSTSCSATQPASGNYWIVSDSMSTTPITASSGTFDFTISFTGVAGDPAAYFQDFSGQFFFNGSQLTNLAWAPTGNPDSWATPQASKAGNNGSCNGNTPGSFCASGTPTLLSNTTATTFELTGDYTGTFLDSNGQYHLQFAAQNTSSTQGNGGGNVFAVSQDFTNTGQVPDGGMTVMLLGGALVGLEALRRRMRA